MPFQSKAQMNAAFGGYLGSDMKKKASTWAKETPNIKGLPEHKKLSKALDGLKKAKPKEKK